MCILLLRLSSTLQCSDANGNDFNDEKGSKSHQEAPVGEIMPLQFVDIGFLSWQGESVHYTPFGVRRRSVNGFTCKRSPGGMLVREETRTFSTNSIVFPDGGAFSEVWKSRSYMIKKSFCAFNKQVLAALHYSPVSTQLVFTLKRRCLDVKNVVRALKQLCVLTGRS